MRHILSAVCLFLSLSVSAKDISFEAAQLLSYGKYAGSTNLKLPIGTAVPYDFRNPNCIFSGLEMGLRYHFLYNGDQTFSMSISAPFQLGLIRTNGPSISDDRHIYAFSMNIPAYLTFNIGMGASKRAEQRPVGFYLSLGAAINKSFVKDREYKFFDGGSIEYRYAYIYNFFPTANANMGVRFKNKDDKVVGLGINTSFGMGGIWQVGLNYSAVVSSRN